MHSIFLAVLLVQSAAAGAAQSDRSAPAITIGADEATPAAKVAGAATIQSGKPDRPTELNLLGKTDTGSGESRRNENVQFNLIENNALKDLLLRTGTTATIVREFRPDQNYYGAEFGDKVSEQIHLSPSAALGTHGSIYEAHNNSIFSARSFFQVGDVRPAHSNDYGLSLGTPLWHGATLSIDGSQQKIRGSVNGNVLVPTLAERIPLTNDPATRAIVERFIAAYPDAAPNRTDINERMLNTNSPQIIDTNNATGRLDQRLGLRDRLSFQYLFTSQTVDAFELIAGQNPDTTTKAHTARVTWNRSWGASAITDFTAGFDRLRSLIVPAPDAVGRPFPSAQCSIHLGQGQTFPSIACKIVFATQAGSNKFAGGTHGARAGNSCGARSTATRRAASAA